MVDNLDAKKTAPTLDDTLDRKMQTILDLINEHMSKVYQDFNTAMMTQNQKVNKIELDLSKGIQVLWGIVNQANARAAALESLLIKNGLSPQELTDELEAIITQMKDSGAWVEIPMEEAMKEGDIPPPPPKNPIG